MEFIVIPGTGNKLYEGDIVALGNYPGTKWIVSKGWYYYNGTQRNGWYLCAASSATNLPLTEVELMNISIISSKGHGCCPPPPGPGPGPGPGPKPNPYTDKEKYQVERSFITVDTIAERDYLFANQLIPDGKIVKVNLTTEGTKYFSWNLVEQKWEDETFGIDSTKYVATADFDNTLINSLNQNKDVQVVVQKTAGADIQWNTIN